MTFQPERLQYKGRRYVGSHVHTLLSYRGVQIVFTVEGGLLTVVITGQRFPAREILEYLGIDPNRPVDESVLTRYGGGESHIFQQQIKAHL
jgi:hypothetical protein